MKLTISYEPDEEFDMLELVDLIRSRYPKLKCRKSDRYPPFHHVYLTTRKRRRPQDKGKEQ